jgi:aerobic C4-dicarboxylate transport protein
VGIDRFMSEARAVTNFAGNAVATVLVGHWTGGLDRARLDRVLGGELPFDETTMLDDDDLEVPVTSQVPVQQAPVLQPA